jgi:glucose-1-phosphate cytidylyltransferase
LATVSAIQPVGRFGSLEIHEDKVTSFLEKPKGDNRWISGGFFVCEPEIIDYIYDDNTILEREPLENLAKQNQLSVWKHEDFWSSMDTLRDKQFLDNLWNTNQAPWKLW